MILSLYGKIRVSENLYFRIVYAVIRTTVENIEKYTLACLSLHNSLQLTDNASLQPSGFVDSEGKNDNILPD